MATIQQPLSFSTLHAHSRISADTRKAFCSARSIARNHRLRRSVGATSASGDATNIRNDAVRRAPLENRDTFSAKYVPFSPGTDSNE
eukprot:361101-Pyramimonas_sp.AAC.1